MMSIIMRIVLLIAACSAVIACENAQRALGDALSQAGTEVGRKYGGTWGATGGRVAGEIARDSLNSLAEQKGLTAHDRHYLATSLAPSFRRIGQWSEWDTDLTQTHWRATVRQSAEEPNKLYECLLIELMEVRVGAEYADYHHRWVCYISKRKDWIVVDELDWSPPNLPSANDATAALKQYDTPN